MAITYEEIGELFTKSIKAKFPGVLFREGLLRFIDGNESNNSLENIEITQAGISLLKNEVYFKLKKEDTFVEEYMFRFSKDNLGISKTLYSPRNRVIDKLDRFLLKNNVTQQQVLEAVDNYHQQCFDNGNITFSSDAQYFIEKDGGSLLLDFVNDIKTGNSYTSYNDLVVYGD